MVFGERGTPLHTAALDHTPLALVVTPDPPPACSSVVAHGGLQAAHAIAVALYLRTRREHAKLDGGHGDVQQ